MYLSIYLLRSVCDLGCGHCEHDESLGIAPQRVLQQTSEFGVSVRHVIVMSWTDSYNTTSRRSTNRSTTNGSGISIGVVVISGGERDGNGLFGESGDDVAQRTQRLVDVAGLCEANSTGVGLSHLS